MNALTELQVIAVESLAALDTGHQIQPFFSRTSTFNLDDAYRVTAAVRKMREARGSQGGFTTRKAWVDYNVNEPPIRSFKVPAWCRSIEFGVVGQLCQISSKVSAK
jgi:2-keto-4-pentenoate hydratase